MVGATLPCGLRIGDARALAADILAGRPDRWRHTVGVAHRADELVVTIGNDDPVVLVSAAWLHDIGYADTARDSGFHPIDAARYLRRLGWPSRVVALLAHHSGARFVAVGRGMESAMGEFVDEATALSDALTYADLTVGPDGGRLSLEARLADMLRRHGPSSPNARVHHERAAHLMAVAARVERRFTLPW